jgi:hypothetical protein
LSGVRTFCGAGVAASIACADMVDSSWFAGAARLVDRWVMEMHG